MSETDVDLDVLARRLMREHNRLLKECERLVGTALCARGFLVAWPDRPSQHWSTLAAQTSSFPHDSYVLPVLTVPTTARDVLLWINGRSTGKHANWDLRA